MQSMSLLCSDQCWCFRWQVFANCTGHKMVSGCSFHCLRPLTQSLFCLFSVKANCFDFQFSPALGFCCAFVAVELQELCVVSQCRRFVINNLLHGTGKSLARAKLQKFFQMLNQPQNGKMPKLQTSSAEGQQDLALKILS